MPQVNYSDINAGIRTVSQIALEWDSSVKNEAVLAYLGVNNELAYTYQKGKLFYCADEQSRWEWRSPLTEDEQGLMPEHFVYPAGLEDVNEINYSEQAYNFFPYNVSNTVNFQQLVDSLYINLGWKKGQPYVVKDPSELPSGVTNYPQAENVVYSRTGTIGYKEPFVDGGIVNFPSFIDGIEYPAQLITANVLNLIVDIKDFDKIKNYQPKLLFSRYTPSRIKKTPIPVEISPGNFFPQRTIKTGKYRIDSNENLLRINRIPLNNSYNVIDFGQEHYFSVNKNFQMNPATGPKVMPRGIGKKNMNFNNNKVSVNNPDYLEYSAYLYLELHVQITVEGINYLSVPLSRFKMQCVIKYPDENDKLTYTSEIRYKHV